MKSIVKIPNPVLSSPAKTVTNFDKKLHDLVKQMEKALVSTRKPKGVGLAAPQVEVGLRVCITRPTAKDKIRVFINPEIIGVSEEKTDGDDQKLEGCLSIPNIWGHVSRAKSVTLKYQDIKGDVHEEVFEGFLATIVQHETDHTNGVLFTQRVVEQNGKLYRTVKDKEGKETLEEITI